MKRLKGTVLLLSILVVILCSCSKSQEAQWQEQYDLGIRYLSESKYEEAVIAFKATIDIDAQKAEGYHGLADVYIALSNIEAAITVLNQGYEETGDNSFIDRCVALENEQLPILTEEGRRNLIWAYTLLETKNFTTLCQEGDQLYIDSYYTFPFDEYIGLCFDGAELHRKFDGIGLKIIDNQHWYFGQLVSGEPEGMGISYCYRPQTEGNGALFYELYEGEWRGGKANGNGVLTNMIGNIAGEQCCHTYEGIWVDNSINGEVVEINYVDDIIETEYYYACESGFYVLDERWIRRDDGSYVLPPEYSLYNVAKSYQSEVQRTVFD